MFLLTKRGLWWKFADTGGVNRSLPNQRFCQLMDTVQILEHCGVTERHCEALGQAVPEAYAALAKLAASTPMLGGFVQGRRGLSYLRDISVQHALEAKAAETRLFFTSTAWNRHRNYCFLQLQVGQTIFTTHYAGANGSRAVRKAASRAELVMRTPDLFAATGEEPDMSLVEKSAYVQLVHAGVTKPKFVLLQIPNRDQHASRLAPLILDMQSPLKGAVEEVQDRLNEAFKRKAVERAEQGNRAS